jgi:hypothetical protein
LRYNKTATPEANINPIDATVLIIDLSHVGMKISTHSAKYPDIATTSGIT